MVSYLGQSLNRFEDTRLLKGQGTFVDDIQIPDTLHAYAVRSPHASARIISVDSSAALSAPGVVTVLTGEDIRGILGDVPTRTMEGERAVSEMRAVEQPAVARDRVCYVGQAVAIVVATDRYTAQDAADLVVVDYEPLVPLVDAVAGLEAEATLVHPDLGTNVGLRISQHGGDVEAAFAQAAHRVKERFEVQRLAPAPMETRGVLATYEARDDSLTVWSSTQEPHQLRQHLAAAMDLPNDRVRVVAPDVGGGFGQKSSMFPEEFSTPYLARLLGRPVKWIEDRQENMLAFHGRGYTIDLDAAVAEDGAVLGMRARIVADLGAFFLMSTPSIPLLAGHRISGPYKTPAMEVDVLGVFTNKPPTGAYRGAGGPESAYCVERTLDLIAKDLGIDPAEVRRRNLIPSDAFPFDTPTGLTYDSGDYERALDRALELSDYDAWRRKAAERSSDGPLLGVGLATVVKASGGAGEMRTDVAEVRVEPSGRVIAYTGISPHGQGTETTFAQIVATELGVTPADVVVTHGDTGLYPKGGGTAASRGMVVGSSALQVVAEQARAKLARIAAQLLGCSASDVTFGSGQAYAGTDSSRSIPFTEVASAAYDEERLPPGEEPGLLFEGSFTLPGATFGFGAHVAVVEVDRDTGDVKIVKYAAVHDVGRVVNPMLLDGQIHGAIVQGIGQALTEGFSFGPDGQPLTASLLDYSLPVADGIPIMELDTIETPSPLTPLGVKGVGELPTVAAPVAVANAVMDALSTFGVRDIETPLTPERVWRAIHGKGE